jgi:hypothetical protein
MSCAPIRNMLTDARDSRRDPEVNAQRGETGAQRSRGGPAYPRALQGRSVLREE